MARRLAAGLLAMGFACAAQADDASVAEAGIEEGRVVEAGAAEEAGLKHDADADSDHESEARLIAAYQAEAARRARDYDRAQDISPQQLLSLLEVSERTGKPLGQVLATGEFESAGTWNDFVRPTLDNGRLGSATGVWQFIPNTFFLIIKRYGEDLLAASAADPSQGREWLDLGAGPFNDAQVRSIIQETVDGHRDADDKQLQLLRHNFTVLAFAKHYLSVDSGAQSPEEDYLFHFLGETRGRQVLALARGEARHTLSVKSSAPELDANRPGLAVLEGAGSQLPTSRPRLLLRPASARAAESSMTSNGLLNAPQQLFPRRSLMPDAGDTKRARPSVRPDSAGQHARPSPGYGRLSLPDLAPFESRSAEWGLPADSPIVTGNPGMFYRNASARTDPYTWAEFLQALSRRVKARSQPAMVRAKYGVGFPLNGGDMAGWTLKDDEVPKRVEFRNPAGGRVLLPEKLLTAPLDAEEMQAYKARLAELIALGETEPLALLPASAVMALQHLGVMDPKVTELAAGSPALAQALAAFRELVGKGEPDDPAFADRLMPAERVALELYDQRLAQYAALQSGQQAALSRALDLLTIRQLLKSHRRASRPYIIKLQQALAEQGLQTQVGGQQQAKRQHFDGIVGKLTLAALDRFQLHNGLLPTQGRLDAATAAALGLPPIGPEIFFVPTGPQSLLPAHDSAAHAEQPAQCQIPTKDDAINLIGLLQQRQDVTQRLIFWRARQDSNL
ncbi:MAG: peptidoglycan-binding domain-containing protein [Lamprobacter sp.]|uniref:peptidoglycan-binding domain-containing protein n=1 Tax=Lamprobacter sp. TaxID=3100796 RepID=UPI002B25AEDE|nr:peptidoglycan-binding domain-containing protein [Lamprobacter sp.]MEA3641120.1 peptidoglycan-binding domain-containing protein [Lamprobacter sp.]